MFLPNDLTAAETDLVASITRQVMEHRAPSTSAEETAARTEAAQVAAEMIWEARRQSEQYVDEEEDQDLEQDLAQSPYHQRLQAARERNLEIQEAEDREADQPL